MYIPSHPTRLYSRAKLDSVLVKNLCYNVHTVRDKLMGDCMTLVGKTIRIEVVCGMENLPNKCRSGISCYTGCPQGLPCCHYADT